MSDWIVLANRAAGAPLISDSLAKLGLRLGFRTVPGCSEHVSYRQLFPLGLTAFDCLDQVSIEALRGRCNRTPEGEMRALMESLRLPINERGLRRSAARSEWLLRKDQPLPTDEILADER